MRHLVVDWEQCDGHGLCAVLLPEVIDEDEWGFPVIRIEVPPALEPAARTAVGACPSAALRLRT